MTTDMKFDYLVVWQLDGPVMQSGVCISDGSGPNELDNAEWITLAAASEGFDPEETYDILEDGYSLFLVVPFPTAFYGD